MDNEYDLGGYIVQCKYSLLNLLGIFMLFQMARMQGWQSCRGLIKEQVDGI